MHPYFLLFTTTIFILIYIPGSFCQDDEQYRSCGEPFRCGSMDIVYPFWGGSKPEYCGHPSFEIKCESNIPKITIESAGYEVIDINTPNRIVTLARDDLLSNICLDNAENASFDLNTFSYLSSDLNITLYFGCTLRPGSQLPASSPNRFNCNSNIFGIYTLINVPFDLSLVTCQEEIIVRVNQTNAVALASPTASVEVLKRAIAGGFSVNWTATIDSKCNQCDMSGGRCGSNPDSGDFACHCENGTHPNGCNNGQNQAGDNGKKNQTPLAVGLGVGGAVLAGIGVGWLVFFCRQKRKRIASQASPVQTESKDLPILSSSNGLSSSSTPSSTTFTRSIPSYPSSKSEADYGRGSSYFGAHVFSFAELEEATNNFDPSKELGDGGFGVVYYGKLHDGRVVAVKRLYENNFKRVEQFMNEVEILTQLRHKNLVTLYGCTSKRSRDLLLVYEYIPNGTVADHLHGKRAKSGLLSWPVRMNIAIETAEALAYLHSSIIIHRDVKTNNILLDNDFHVKVADFGLSRLFPTNVTHVSTAPQGTPGYVDPEYYQCYQLTEKSDVYSFGVVLVELISSLEAVDTNRHRHDINLSNMAVNKIQGHSIHELVDPTLGFSTNSSVRRMTTLVAELAFRCLQQERDLRPSMQEVLETLRGIQNGESKAHNAEVLDIVVDDVGLLKDSLSSPESVAADK
ncbi:LEAF RUST 10 DISEASE-RESISTANCE LOCUS RECEPTOR-LIKE PROTEIN KINASE-like 1.4 isoform X3 [Solanum pennellii]|uniref:non-specific serine/threonine protein kinase n=1 Tax=Solanum pennellii TaxID=28526 RepID=A0ABM1V2X2_SOLPN|nr:LEAF RUST 10 DISEASE-RESISTANCE LOCUS RECEPTOR-LIKE PROTEIN KINASE-like 1.4 isoform X3 [Solanum pennellii]